MVFVSIVILFICVFVLFSKCGELQREILKQRKVNNDLWKKIKELAGGGVAAEPPRADVAEPVAVAASVAPVPEPVVAVTPPTPPPPKPKRVRNENWVGVNLLNRLGALLIVIGAIATAAFDGFPAPFRSLILFVFALGWIVVGEFINRKKTSVASLGVSATGVGLVYVAIAVSYFALGTIGMYSALIACIMATVLGVLLAIRYNAQVIGCFALIGGYLPILALDPLDQPMLIGLIVYFVLLSLFSLSLALAKKWSPMNFLGFALTVIGTSYLGWFAEPTIALIYACFAFFLYTALPLLAVHRTGEAFSEVDVWLIAMNTFISSLVIFFIANRLDIQHLHAYLSLAFALIYAGVAAGVRLQGAIGSKNMSTIFTLTSIAFFALFVPFYFEREWFGLAWLVQAVVLACYGIMRGKKLPEFCGLVILGIAAWALLFDLLLTSQFTFKYTFFTIGTLAVLGSYLAMGRRCGGFKCTAFANLWVFSMYVMGRYIDYDNVSTLCALVTFALAFAYAVPKIWADNGTRILANILHGIGLLTIWVMNFVYRFSLFGSIPNGGGLVFNLLATILAFSMVVHYYSNHSRSGWMMVYKNLNLANLWLVSLWVLGFMLEGFAGNQMILVILTFAIGMLITRIPGFSDAGTKAIAIIMHSIGLVWLWGINSLVYTYFSLMFLNAVTQFVAMVSLHDAMKLCSQKAGESPFKIVLLSSYFLLILTQAMMVQGGMAFNNAIISIIFAVAAFAWIVLGFYLKSKPMRKFGLYVTIASIAKLLIVDTWGLSAGMRIISYVSLGLLLMLISFIYQKLNKDA